VARVYEMAFDGTTWTLHRSAEPPDSWQRFTGTLSGDAGTIDGRWESSDDGATWRPDFDLTYTRIGT
jgi:hypothetical protein